MKKTPSIGLVSSELVVPGRDCCGLARLAVVPSFVNESSFCLGKRAGWMSATAAAASRMCVGWKGRRGSGMLWASGWQMCSEDWGRPGGWVEIQSGRGGDRHSGREEPGRGEGLF